MPSKISVQLKRKSSGVFTVYFKDEDGVAVTPNTATWTLMDSAGNVINERDEVSISSLSTSVDITIYGDDLNFQAGESEVVTRFLRVDSTYDSGSVSDLPLIDHVEFDVVDVKGS